MKKILFVLLVCICLAGCVTNTREGAVSNNIDYSDKLIYFHAPLDDPLSLSEVSYETFLYNNVPVIPVSDIKDIPLLEESTSSGSGFFIGPDLVLTNQHVIDSADEISVVYDGQEHGSEVLFSDEEYDIALLKVPFENSVYFAFSNQYSLASDIFVMGYPLSDVLGSDIRITNGIVNSMSGLDGDSNFIQISAQVQPGNSGGPVIDDEFKVVGMATSRLSDLYMLGKSSTIPQNVNFAIKSQMLALFLSQYLDNQGNEGEYVDSLDDAIQSTVMVISKDHASTSNVEEQYLFTLEYSFSSGYSFLVGARRYSVDQATMKCFDLRSGEVIASMTKFRNDYGATISNAEFIDRLTADLLTELGV